MPTPTRNRQPALPAPSEKDLLKGAKDLISARGVVLLRNNTGALRNAQGRLVRFGRPGSPDLYGAIPASRVLPHGRSLWAEAKRPGNRPTPLQAAFLAELQSIGAAAFWFDDLRQLRVFLDAALAGWMFGTDASGESVAWPAKGELI
jgi:hypothetical protein